MSEDRDKRGVIVYSTEFEIPPPAGDFKSTPSNLLPHLPTLRQQLLRRFDRQKDPERRRAKFQDLDFLPYALSAAKTAIENFIRIQEELVQEAFHEGDLYTGRYQLDWWRLGYTVDGFLEASVRTQDTMIKYWMERFACNLPSQLDKVVKDKKGCRARLPEPVLRDLDAYWQRSGELVRNYRHLSQHHAIVASEAEATPGDEGRFVVRVFLPNNPQESSTLRLSYEDPEVPAYPFLARHFAYLLGFAYGQTRMMILRDDSDAGQIVGHAFRLPKLLGSERVTWYRMVSQEEFHHEIGRLQEKLDSWRWSQQGLGPDVLGNG